MHRTRHSLMDYIGGGAPSQEEWSEFLSTSMMALSTADSEAPPVSPTRRHHHHPGDEISVGRLRTKPRGMSMSEAKIPADAWRPLGRRVASPPLTLPSSPESLSPPSLDNNEVEHHGPVKTHVNTVSATLKSAPSLQDTEDAKLKHVNSLREVVSSCLSSSGSSICDSSSDEEQLQQSHINQSFSSSIPAPLAVNPSFTDAAFLPVLSQLSLPPRSISVDSGNGARTGSMAHVKSPVLGNKKDAQTWRLQDEEFLMTSPRFESSLRNPDEGHADLFRGNSVGSLLSSETSNQCIENYRNHTRLSKDSRASSVDFTLQRSNDVIPPLPPPPEPYQRLRARSFSYSPADGSAGYIPFNGSKQCAPSPYHHMPLQQAMEQEFSQSLRRFHSASGMMQPGQPQPPHGGVRPPRACIPTDSHIHQYQYGPPMPFRRYSDAFAMPPFPDSFYGEQQENQPRPNDTGRGLRSYSMEYGNYTSTRQIRSQSMEGPQFFASAPPMDCSPSLSRSNSAGISFDWPRRHMDSAPPLPPNTHMGGNGAPHFHPPPPEDYYDVEFKRGRQEIFAGRASYKPGDYVKVEADRGEDIGRIVQRTKGMKFRSVESAGPEEAVVRSKHHDLPTKNIICVANQQEYEMLNEQRIEEHQVFEVCKSKVRQRLLPMNVIDAEYQFDRHKLTFFFEADRRIDFRELVRDLFAIYKTRIWLQQVVPSGKKAENV